VSTSGTETTIATFNGTDGGGPTGLVLGNDGSLYGTTEYGGKGTSCGTYACGTAFRVTPRGSITTLHSFDLSDGSLPHGGLVQATNGAFYGTTVAGGSNICGVNCDCGTAFVLRVGLGPFVEPQPAFGKIGGTVKVLGTSLTGTTSVTFNGTTATFKVISPFLVGATVPVGAITGPVQVVTPTGTLTSNVNFRVLP